MAARCKRFHMPDAKKIISLIALAILNAAIGIIFSKAFQAWGVFDPFSQWLGTWLKVHVTSDQAGWTAAAIIAIAGYAFSLWFVRRYFNPISGQPAQDNRRALIAEARNFVAATLSEGRDNHDMAYFQPALEASEIYLKLRPYLKGNFHQVLRGRILIASASSQSKVPGKHRHSFTKLSGSKRNGI